MGRSPIAHSLLAALFVLLGAHSDAAAQTVSGACNPPSGQPGLNAVSKLLDAIVAEERPASVVASAKKDAPASSWKVKSIPQKGPNCAINAVSMAMNYWKDTKGTWALPTYGERSMMTAAVALGLSTEDQEGHTYTQYSALAQAFKNHYDVTALKMWNGDIKQLEALVKQGPVVTSFAMAKVEDVPAADGHDFHAVVLVGMTDTHVRVVDGMFFPDGATFPRDQFEAGWRAGGSTGILFQPKSR